LILCSLRNSGVRSAKSIPKSALSLHRPGTPLGAEQTQTSFVQSLGKAHHPCGREKAMKLRQRPRRADHSY
jgi:hypothetical protein